MKVVLSHERDGHSHGRPDIVRHDWFLPLGSPTLLLKVEGGYKMLHSFSGRGTHILLQQGDNTYFFNKGTTHTSSTRGQHILLQQGDNTYFFSSPTKINLTTEKDCQLEILLHYLKKFCFVICTVKDNNRSHSMKPSMIMKITLNGIYVLQEVILSRSSTFI